MLISTDDIEKLVAGCSSGLWNVSSDGKVYSDDMLLFFPVCSKMSDSQFCVAAKNTIIPELLQKIKIQQEEIEFLKMLLEKERC